jgi:hypothetical protein
MEFNNSGNMIHNYNNVNNSLASINNRPVIRAPTNLPLNAPMIDRIHKAKPGCSACGKKVA